MSYVEGQDTPQMARAWCPGCEPDLDPLRELLEPRPCAAHGADIQAGAEDATANPLNRQPYDQPSGTIEAGGEDNRRWCDLFHRGGRRG